MGKSGAPKLPDIILYELENMWNKINKYLSLPEHCQTFKSVSGFTTPYGIWIYEMLPYVQGTYVLHKNKDTRKMKRSSALKKLKWADVNQIFDVTKGRRPRHRMIPNDEEIRSSYYMSCQEYVYGEPLSVPSPIRKHFRKQDESSCTLWSSGRSEARARQSGKPSLEELANRLIAIELVVLDKEVSDAGGGHQITSMRMFCMVLDEEVIILGTINHFDEDVLDDNETTPSSSPRPCNPSHFLHSHFTDVYIKS
uniref:Uncharacterized protein n=1 Tax=Lactuca sativa TaxID=4236 RepID=A0A9R1WKG4_LACSA|nr:hypothetical protein LSAT_V11C200067630 [Lactuca sativa]